jgi:serine/threonine protein kinase/Tol biopolymer transport system component
VTDAARRRRVEEVCDAALSHTGADRAAFVAAACRDDEALRREVVALLAHAQTAEGFLETSLGAVASSVLTDKPASFVGQQIGAYRILSPLGAGGMGEVYRARDTKLRREVAFKVLPASVAHDPNRLARFEREARVLATLNHPHIAAIYGVEDADGVRGLVLELVEGPTLADRLTTGRLSVKDALKIAFDIAEALEAAHEKGIVHRDLKPANVKLAPSGAVKVLDFGLAKAWVGDAAGADQSSGPAVTATAPREGLILGTPAYMSPEQARGAVVDKRADIWALGCVLFEMLTGRPPFQGSSITEVLAAVLEHEPEWDVLPPDTPPKVHALLRRCLRKDPKRRLRDIGDARIEIEETLATPDADVAVVSKARRSRGRLALVITAAAVVAGAAVGLALYLRPTAVQDTRGYQSSILLPAGMNVASLPFQRFALSPDGRLLVFGARTRNEPPQLWVQPLDGLPPRELPGAVGVTPFWSPDSRFVGFYAGLSLRTIAVAGGPPQTVADVSSGNPGATWNRDNVILFSATGEGSVIMRVSASGGTVSPVTALDRENGETQHWAPFFLPDGRHFLYVAIGTRSGGPASVNGIYVAALDSNERKLLVAGGASPRYARGFLLFLRDQTLMAQPFDVEGLALGGDAVPAAEQVATGGLSGRMGAVTVSDNGVLAYQRGSRGDLSQLVWVDRTGQQLEALSDRGDYGDVTLSPDGRRAAVSFTDAAGNNRDIWLFDIPRGLRTRFTFDQAEEVSLIWSPDGGTVAFSSQRKGFPDVYGKSSGGGNIEDVLLAESGSEYPLSWSRDGRFLLYAFNGRGSSPRNLDLWVLPLFGDRKPFPFMQTSFTESAAAFSPDSRWVAYASDESGRNEVYAAPFPGPGGKWQVSTTGGNWPRWRRDGREIFYMAPDNRLMVAAVDGQGSGFQISTVRPLFETRARINQRSMYDVSPDGQRFLINTIVEQAVQPITLVVNWPALLKQ